METQAQTTSARLRREPWNKGKIIGQKPPLRPNMYGRSVPIADGGTDARLGNVQSGNRQQAARLRCRRTSGRGRRTERVCGRSRHTTAEEDRSARQTRQAVDDYIKAAGKNRVNFCSVAVVITTAV